MFIRFEITTQYGVLIGEQMEVNDEQLEIIQSKSKEFYKSGFEMYTEDGLVIVPPEVTKMSILKIKIEGESNADQQQV